MLFRLVCCLSFLLLAPPPVQGQRLALKWGFNQATQTGHGFFEASRKTFPRVGVSSTLSLGGPWSLQPELHLSRQGSSLAVSFGAFDIKGGVTLDALDLPVLVRLDLAPSSTKPYLVAGPYLALKLKATITLNAVVEGVGRDERVKVLDEMEDLDYGVVFGLGVSQPLERLRLLVEARWVRGLRKLSVGGDAPVRNNIFCVLFGLAF